MSTHTDAAREAARSKTTGQFGEQRLADPGSGVLASAEPQRDDLFLAPGDDTYYHFRPGRMGEWDYVPEQAHEKVRVAAAAAIYRRLEQPEAIRGKLEELARTGGRAQLLIDRVNLLQLKECRILRVQTDAGRPVVRVRGKGTSHGSQSFPLEHIAAVERGYGGTFDSVNSTFARRRAQFVPRTSYADPRTDLPNGDTDTVQAVYMFGSRNFGSWDDYKPGSLFLATGRGDNLVEGFLWEADGHGFPAFAPTFYADDMKGSVGRLTDYRPGTVTVRSVNDMPNDPVEAYRFVMGARYHEDEA